MVFWIFTELDRRLEGHNIGLNKSTAEIVDRGEFIFIREFDNKSEALKFENYLKSLRNKDYIQHNFRNFF